MNAVSVVISLTSFMHRSLYWPESIAEASTMSYWSTSLMVRQYTPGSGLVMSCLLSFLSGIPFLVQLHSGKGRPEARKVKVPSCSRQKAVFSSPPTIVGFSSVGEG
ncbi:hypothetical protein E2C01_030476 [Portunus trituberculatus]|uniref:Uncharacterized protein n=1 Tax=Portunus trituberculatus TaxID=210409 RepID=A0A5B7EUC6_PORTR|nr:hypothetical protein [Portunus trituberculatus]